MAQTYGEYKEKRWFGAGCLVTISLFAGVLAVVGVAGKRAEVSAILGAAIASAICIVLAWCMRPQSNKLYLEKIKSANEIQYVTKWLTTWRRDSRRLLDQLEGERDVINRMSVFEQLERLQHRGDPFSIERYYDSIRISETGRIFARAERE